MDQEKIIQQVMAELQKQNAPSPAEEISVVKEREPAGCGLTEFVGVAPGDTIGFVLANVDAGLRKELELDPKYKSIGMVGSRTGAAPQALAADEAVKASNAEVVRLEMPRDTKGGPGHGILVVFGAEEVSDARRAVEIMLSGIKTYFGGVYTCGPGHVDSQYTARASQVFSKYFGATEGKAFGIVGAAPASIGIVAADALLKSADVEIVAAMSPTKGCNYSNEYIVTFSGDSGAVKQAVLTGREIALKALRMMGEEPVCAGTPYLE